MSAEVGEVKYKVTLDDSGIDGEAKKAESKIKSSFGAGAKNVAAGIGRAAAAGVKAAAGAVVAGTTAMGAFAKASIDAGMDFDSSMSQVAATMGKTVDEIQDLRDFAQEMGSKTAFSATEAADALNYMALAGYDAQTSMEMLPNVLNLAAAGGIELASASDMITDSQSALGLSLDETSKLVDQMAKAASKSNTSVAQLGDAILTIGGTAKSLKGGTTELSTALGILADNGVKGSEGGTALRNILLSLQNPIDKAADKMDKLGLQVYDSEGKMRSLEDIMGDFNGILDDMSDQERSEVLDTIFNKVDLKSVNALLDTSAERWKELSGAIDDSAGAAQKMADTQLDNLAGDVTLFQSALEGAKIAISDELTPQLRGFVQFGSDGLSKLTEAFKKDGLTGAMDTLGEVLADGLNMIVDMLPDAVDAGMELIGAIGQGIMDNRMDILFAGFDIVEALLDGILEAMSSDGENAIVTIVGDILGVFEENYVQIIDTGAAIIFKLIEGIIGSVGQLLDWGPYIIDQLARSIIENAPDLLRSASEMILQLAQGLSDAIEWLAPIAVDLILQFVQFLLDPDNIGMIVDAAITIIMGLADGLISAIPVLLEQAPVIVEKFIDAIIAAAPKITMAALELIVKLVGGILTNLPKIAESAFKIVARLIDGIGKYLDMVKNTGGKIIDRVKEGIAKLNPLTWGKDLISNFVKGILSGIGEVGEAVGRVADKIRAFLHFSEPDEGPLADFSSYGPDLVDTFAKGIEDNAHKAAEAAEGLAGDIAMGFTSDINYNVPDIAGYAADLSASITGTGSTRIEVPVVIDGREIARASAWYMGEQLAWEAR